MKARSTQGVIAPVQATKARSADINAMKLIAAIMIWRRSKISASAPDTKATLPPKERKRREAELRQEFSRETRDTKRALDAAEARIAKIEAELAAIDGQLADPAFATDAGRLREAYEQRETLVREHETQLERWEELSLEFEERRNVLDTALAAL